MAIQNTILIGNGINRWIKDNPVPGDDYRVSWKSTLERLANRANYKVRDIDQKPLTLVFDELLLNANQMSKIDLQKLAMQIALIQGDADLNNIYSCVSNQFLTTNYYASFASNGYGFMPHHLGFEVQTPLFPQLQENTFSLFRARKARSKIVWNIHGGALNPTSITLGHRQYARYQNQISNYLSNGISYAKVKNLKSPLFAARPDFEFEKSGNPYSWIDLFLRDHINMVGFGMDYTESILWWLLTEKFHYQKRYPKHIGGMTYHHVAVDEIPTHEQVKLHMLEDLGVKVNIVNAKDYKTGYLDIADTIKPGILKLFKAKDYKGMYKLK